MKLERYSFNNATQTPSSSSSGVDATVPNLNSVTSLNHEDKPPVEHDLAEVAAASELTSRTTAELAVRAQQGCAAAFAELFKRYQPRLVRFLGSRVRGSQLDVEDIAQEALAKAWQSIERFDARFQFATWLYTIAHRAAIDSLRRKTPTAVENLPEHLDHAADPKLRFEQSESAQNIWAIAQRELKADHFSALWLRYGEDLSVKEVALVLKKTSVGTRVLLHRARCALEPHLESYADDEGPVRSENASDSNYSREGFAQ